jgi:hypothetical protein
VAAASGGDPVGDPRPLEDGDAFGVGGTAGPGGEAEESPRGAQRHERGDTDRQQGKLQSFEGLDPSSLGGQGGHEGGHQENGGQRRQDQPSSAGSLPDPRTVLMVGPVVGWCVGRS